MLCQMCPPGPAKAWFGAGGRHQFGPAAAARPSPGAPVEKEIEPHVVVVEERRERAIDIVVLDGDDNDDVTSTKSRASL